MNTSERFTAGALAERLLRTCFSSGAAKSIVGDLLEDIECRRVAGDPCRFPRTWLLGQVLVHAAQARKSRGARASRSTYRRSALTTGHSSTRGSTAGLGQDIRHAVRLLLREPGYVATAVLAIALGIGATTTLFSVTYGVLLKPLPWPEPERLVRLEERRGGRTGRVPLTITNSTYLAWRESTATLESIGGWMSTPATFGDGSEPERIKAGRLTPSIFNVLDAQPLAGRVFNAEDAASRNVDTVILSHGFWQRRFGGDRAVIGRSIRVDYSPYTVVGIMPAGFAFPDSDTDLWLPAYIAPVFSGDGASVSLQIFSAIARMRSATGADHVSAEGTARARSTRDPGPTVLALFGSSEPPTVVARPALDVMVSDVRPGLHIILAAVLLLFVTALASVATVQLARAATRRREMTMRVALGAGTGRLARHWLVESGMVGLTGGVVGVVGAWLLLAVLPAILPADFPRAHEIDLDWRVALVASLTTFTAIAVCGLLPTLESRRIDLVRALSEDSPGAFGGSRRTSAARLRTAIMAGQIAVACVLLIGAGLLGRTFQSLLHVDRGYNPNSLLTARLSMRPGSTFAKDGATLRAITDRLKALPGVEHASFGNALPFVSAGNVSGFKARLSRDPTVETNVQALHRTVDSGYFAALALRLRAGRLFSDRDVETSQPVMVVNRSFADQYLGANPVGQRIPLNLYRKAEWEVIGVVEDMKQGGLERAGLATMEDGAQPEMFSPYRQFGAMRLDSIFLAVRTTSDPAALAPLLRSIVREQSPDVALDSVRSMEDRLLASLSRPRSYALVMAGFAAFALAIAAVGLFGVLSYGVAQRSREIGVRTALGADTLEVVRLVVRSAMSITAVGLAVGLVAASLLVGFLRTVLSGVEPYDPMTFAAVPIVLALMAVIASAVPARRAARIDPLRALRSD